ncbi:Maf family nucleotide pyrophosphatase [Deminuibacter soli]|uniref:dTTP/UTP pyrophosphatase n=1 Tax=Deminuibacter soli TaxID=2291815 RepID=A0A3E1NGK4_9BACT|nr:Maf family nucleotide pyrophosphatase [Deminuibacter soli]RFM27090.1 septum formation protein Maf [Deminuibacter soli]
MKSIILASQSPRRKQLLEWAEVPFEVVTQSTDETYPAGMALPEIPVHIAREKALAVKKMVQHAFHAQHAKETILAADTLVMLGDKVIGKPKDRDDAVAILTELAGNTHLVITGVVILHAGGEIAFQDTTEVSFHPLTQEQIEYYVDTYQPYDKAGAYAIQEWIGVTGIARINGDFYNVMGLPVSRVVQALEQLGGE